jgi:poly(A) polymerase Pap1
MEIQKQNSEKYQIKAKIKEFIEETNEIFESKARQMNSIIQSLKNDHNRIMLKSKLSSILFYQISYEYM